MHSLMIQLQLDRSHRAHTKVIMVLFSTPTLLTFTVASGKGSKYVNYSLQSRSPRAVWEKLGEVLNAIPGFRTSAIVACTGSRGWDNYRLIQHYNGTSDS